MATLISACRASFVLVHGEVLTAGPGAVGPPDHPAEGDAQAHPDCAPGGSLFQRDHVLAAVRQQVDRQHSGNDGEHGGPGPERDIHGGFSDRRDESEVSPAPGKGPPRRAREGRGDDEVLGDTPLHCYALVKQTSPIWGNNRAGTPSAPSDRPSTPAMPGPRGWPSPFGCRRRGHPGLRGCHGGPRRRRLPRPGPPPRGHAPVGASPAGPGGCGAG